MADKVITIIGTAEPGKARTGVMYALNARKHGWLKDVKLFFFGPAEELLLQDQELQQFLREYQTLEGIVVACKFIADRDSISEQVATLGVQVEYVGAMISDLIKDGYIPLVW